MEQRGTRLEQGWNSAEQRGTARNKAPIPTPIPHKTQDRCSGEVSYTRQPCIATKTAKFIFIKLRLKSIILVIYCIGILYSWKDLRHSISTKRIEKYPLIFSDSIFSEILIQVDVRSRYDQKYFFSVNFNIRE